MLILCPFVPCNCLCILFLCFIVSTCFYVILISDITTNTSNVNISNENSNGEKSNSLIDTYDQKDEAKIESVEFNFTNGNEFTICFLYLIIMSTCMLLFCNIFPEYCFRKRIKIEKCKHVIVQKACGCSIVYDTIKEP